LYGARHGWTPWSPSSRCAQDRSVRYRRARERDGHCERRRGHIAADGTGPRSNDYFLKLDGIQGGSTDARHRDQIDLLSFSWSIKATAAGGGGAGSGTGKAVPGDFTFLARTSAASPRLFVVCATGQHIQTAVFTVARNRAGRPTDYIKITLTDVLVSSYAAAATPSTSPA